MKSINLNLLLIKKKEKSNLFIYESSIEKYPFSFYRVTINVTFHNLSSCYIYFYSIIYTLNTQIVK